MPAFNFQNRFAEDVRTGAKRQTIRAKRKVRPEPGQTAHCFTGMRTRQCERLGGWPIVEVADVVICRGIPRSGGVLFIQGAMVLTIEELEQFAKNDGFDSWAEMLDWFKTNHGLPFYGDLIAWSFGEGE